MKISRAITEANKQPRCSHWVNNRCQPKKGCALLLAFSKASRHLCRAIDAGTTEESYSPRRAIRPVPLAFPFASFPRPQLPGSRTKVADVFTLASATQHAGNKRASRGFERAQRGRAGVVPSFARFAAHTQEQSSPGGRRRSAPLPRQLQCAAL